MVAGCYRSHLTGRLTQPKPFLRCHHVEEKLRERTIHVTQQELSFLEEFLHRRSAGQGTTVDELSQAFQIFFRRPSDPGFVSLDDDISQVHVEDGMSPDELRSIRLIRVQTEYRSSGPGEDRLCCPRTKEIALAPFVYFVEKNRSAVTVKGMWSPMTSPTMSDIGNVRQRFTMQRAMSWCAALFQPI